MATTKKAAGKKPAKAQPAKKPRKGGQAGIFDREVKDTTLAAHCRDYFESADNRPANVKAKNRDAKKAIDLALATMTPHLADGEVVRVGEYMLTNTNRSGGGFEVKAWGPKPSARIRRAS